MNKRIILVGGGGHCKSVIDVIENNGDYEILLIVDSTKNIGQKVLGYPIIGNDSDIYKLMNHCENFLITFGTIGVDTKRSVLFQKLKKTGAKFPTIISKNSYVSRYSSIGDGTVIMNGVIINSNVEIGSNVIINSKALIEHDVKIGNHTQISTGSIINGSAIIGTNCFVGSGSIVNQCLNIYNKATIGAGAVVLNDIDSVGIYTGVPAKKFKPT